MSLTTLPFHAEQLINDLALWKSNLGGNKEKMDNRKKSFYASGFPSGRFYPIAKALQPMLGGLAYQETSQRIVYNLLPEELWRLGEQIGYMEPSFRHKLENFILANIGEIEWAIESAQSLTI